jgi:hypothetical protein
MSLFAWILYRVHGTTLHIEPAYAELLDQAGIHTFRSFFKFRFTSAGRAERSVTRIQAARPDGVRWFYLKAYRYSGWRILRTFLWRAKAEREFANLKAIEAAGAPAVRPAAWAVRRRFGFITWSFIVTEAFEGSTDARALITSYVLNQLSSIPRPAFRAALDDVVDGLRRLHNRGIWLHTAYEKNLMLRMEGGRAAHCWIDLPFAGCCGWSDGAPRGRRVRDLACLHKGLAAILPASDRMRLLCRYLGPEAGRRERKRLAAEVCRKTRSLRDETWGALMVNAMKGKPGSRRQ